MSQENNQLFWCSQCDDQFIMREDISSGTFFKQAGHDIKSGEFRTIEWAVCKNCLYNEKISVAFSLVNMRGIENAIQ